MRKIDAHQHFWHFDPVRDSWITPDMAAIQRDFLPGDLEPVLRHHGFEGCVLVQSAQPEHENAFLLEQAEAHDFVKGVVGWVELLDEDVADKLAYYAQFSKLKGFRYILQGHPDKTIMERPAFRRGMRLLQAYNYTYDLLIYPDQLESAAALVGAFPNQPFVLDHLAKPRIRNGELAQWEKGIRALAKYENVCCKVSGLVTEADWADWRQEDFLPYLNVALETFGTERLLFGSDWPVCLVAASYGEVLGIVEEYFSAFSEREREQLFGGNASAFYHLT